LVKDEIDTDYRCKDRVSVYFITIDKVKEIASRRNDLNTVINTVEKEILLDANGNEKQNGIALDFIYHNDNHKNYAHQMKDNEKRARLKNAVMMVWNKVKEENSIPTLAHMIETLMEKN
jgi:hypothetical protein